MKHEKRSTVHIAVVIPAYQEERLLPRTLASIPEYIQTIIVVDDASSDQTRERALSFAKEVHQKQSQAVRVLSLPHNVGVGRAIVIGYLEAYGVGADLAIVMGADAQMDAQEIPQLLTELSDQVAYVKGDRMKHPLVKERMPKLRYWGNRCLSLCTGLFIRNLNLSDAQCGYTVLRLQHLQDLPLASLYPRYGFPNDLLIRLYESGLNITQVPVTPIYESEKSKLSIPKVILPISALLLRAFLRQAIHFLLKPLKRLK